MFKLKTHLSWKAALLAAVLLALAPTTALAQGFAQGVFYETREKVRVKSTSTTSTRVAKAMEVGSVVYAEGTLADWFGAEVEIRAQSRVDLLTGMGPIDGGFKVHAVGGKGVIPGKISGTLDLSLILADVAPLAPAVGTWQTHGKGALEGTFSGVAQVPVDCAVLGGPAGFFCYLRPDFSGADLLDASEFQDGVPLVRFLIGFTALP